MLGNDSDVDGDALEITGVGQPAHGTATFSATQVRYQGAANYNGPDSFTYTVSDGHGGSATASVAVTVEAGNDAPAPQNDAAATPEDTAVTVAVLDNDSDPDGDSLAIVSVLPGGHGTVEIGSGGLTYTPSANWSGAETIRYTVGDGKGSEASADLTVTVTAVNDLPVAGADAFTIAEDASGTFAVLANDSDPEGGSLTITAAGGAAHGAVSFTATFASYTPAANYNGRTPSPTPSPTRTAVPPPPP